MPESLTQIVYQWFMKINQKTYTTCARQTHEINYRPPTCPDSRTQTCDEGSCWDNAMNNINSKTVIITNTQDVHCYCDDLNSHALSSSKWFHCIPYAIYILQLKHETKNKGSITIEDINFSQHRVNMYTFKAHAASRHASHTPYHFMKGNNALTYHLLLVNKVSANAAAIRTTAYPTISRSLAHAMYHIYHLWYRTILLLQYRYISKTSTKYRCKK